MEPDPKPIAISQISGRYFLFSADDVSFLRREHHVCGVLIGSIPQIPQQNVFLGLPLELMPEEVHLLVRQGVAFVVDDAKSHDEGLRKVDLGRRRDYLSSLNVEGGKAAKQQAGFKEQKRKQALKKLGLTPKSGDIDGASNTNDGLQDTTANASEPPDDPETSLFASTGPPKSISLKPVEALALAVTPATSSKLLATPAATPTIPLPEAPASYPLFAHLHSKGYFLSPGLRFGCQYLVYPGDPLRFHSHFLAIGVNWDQELDLMDIVGGGRLGTGVKKGYLLGGAEPEKDVRTFSIEWAGM